MAIDFADYAEHMTNLGLEVVPSKTGKYFNKNQLPYNILKAPVSLKPVQQDYHHRVWKQTLSYGLINSESRILVLDIDECLSYDFVLDVLKCLNLPTNYEWVIRSGSHTGYHIIVDLKGFGPLCFRGNKAVHAFLPKAKFRNVFTKVEFIRNGYAVLPPSLHSSGFKYEFINCVLPLKKPTEITSTGIETFYLTYCSKETELSLSHQDINYTIPDSYNIPYEKLIDTQLFLIFDLETTGLPSEVEYPDILQVSWSIIDSEGNLYKSRTEMIHSWKENKAYKVNKIDKELIYELGIDLKYVLKELYFDLKNVSGIVAHNLDFDFSILKYHFTESGFDINKLKLDEFCTMKEGMSHYNMSKFPKLKELYFKLHGDEFVYEENIENLHNAVLDKILCTRCFIKLNEY